MLVLLMLCPDLISLLFNLAHCLIFALLHLCIIWLISPLWLLDLTGKFHLVLYYMKMFFLEFVPHSGRMIVLLLHNLLSLLVLYPLLFFFNFSLILLIHDDTCVVLIVYLRLSGVFGLLPFEITLLVCEKRVIIGCVVLCDNLVGWSECLIYKWSQIICVWRLTANWVIPLLGFL